MTEPVSSSVSRPDGPGLTVIRFDGAAHWSTLTPGQQAEIGAAALEYAVGYLAIDIQEAAERLDTPLARAAHAAWDKATADLIAAGAEAVPEAAWRGSDGLPFHPSCLGPVCRACGCSQNDACAGGCAWAEFDLCTACVGPALASQASR